jgi:hypothetical protein
MELRQKAIDSEVFARSAVDPNPNLRKSIRHSASARRDGTTSRIVNSFRKRTSPIAVAVMSFICLSGQ